MDPYDASPDSSASPLDVPTALSPVHAGFPSPAEDHSDQPLSLTRRLVRHPTATFYVRAEGHSMSPMIESGDLLVVDRSRTAVDNDVVIAVVDGDFTVKTMRRSADGRIMLIPVNPAFRPVAIPANGQLDIWGTVTAIVRELVKG
jgi:DNA polymerase V